MASWHRYVICITSNCGRDHRTSTRQASSELNHISVALIKWIQEAGTSSSSGVSSNVDPPLSDQAMMQLVLQYKLGSTGAGCMRARF